MQKFDIEVEKKCMCIKGININYGLYDGFCCYGYYDYCYKLN